MLRLSSALFFVAMGCALTLAIVYQHTAPEIDKQKQILLEQSLQSVLKAVRFEKREDEVVYYEAFDDQEQIIGWCLPLMSKGYGGNMRLLVGIDTKQTITGLKVLEHNETPGLGSKINEKEYKQTEVLFLKQFTGKNLHNLVLVKSETEDNIQAIAGATVSSKAVVDGVRNGVESFLKKKGK